MKSPLHRSARPGTVVGAVTAVLLALVVGSAPAGAAGSAAGSMTSRHAPPTYTNPVSAPAADTFADPSVVRGDDGAWYAFGTSDPLRAGEQPVAIPILRSTDLVTWENAGSAFDAGNRPAWATATSGLWAPDVRHIDGRYVLYFTVTDTTLNADPGDSAIGVATAPTPTGPWTDSGAPVVAPRAAPNGGFLWTFDPAFLQAADGSRWLYYGSYFGGISVTPLGADGLQATGAATQVAIDNRYEGSYVVPHGGWYYLFASAANCCAGPTTGYAVFAGRSRTPAGPFVDRNGVALLDSRVGGTPVIAQNGNRWVGAGHNAVVTDLAGQDWLLYHAIDREDPYLTGTSGINKRPMLLDRLDWDGGWPVVRTGPTDTPRTGPVTLRGERPARPERPQRDPRPGRLIWGTSFGDGLDPSLQWVRQDPAATVADGELVWPTEAADLVGTGNDAGLLLRDAPDGDWLVETKVTIDLGVDTVRNYEQAGLVVRRTDDDFLRLSTVAIWNTRQVEFGKEMPFGDGLSYGGNVGGPPGGTTWLRIAHTVDPVSGEHRYRAGSSPDGRHWTWQGTWTLPPGAQAQVGLQSMGRQDLTAAPATARFDYLRFSQLRQRR